MRADDLTTIEVVLSALEGIGMGVGDKLSVMVETNAVRERSASFRGPGKREQVW